MQFVSETIIDEIIESFENEEDGSQNMEILTQENSILLQFIHEERLELLAEKEQALLRFITFVIYFASRKTIAKTPFIQGNVLEEWEEKNWETLNAHTKKSLSNAFDTFFENYPQEDLLAFVEDTLQPDDDSELSPAGAEIIMVTTKSIIDTLHQQN